MRFMSLGDLTNISFRISTSFSKQILAFLYNSIRIEINVIFKQFAKYFTSALLDDNNGDHVDKNENGNNEEYEVENVGKIICTPTTKLLHVYIY